MQRIATYRLGTEVASRSQLCLFSHISRSTLSVRYFSDEVKNSASPSTSTSISSSNTTTTTPEASASFFRDETSRDKQKRLATKNVDLDSLRIQINDTPSHNPAVVDEIVEQAAHAKVRDYEWRDFDKVDHPGLVLPDEYFSARPQAKYFRTDIKQCVFCQHIRDHDTRYRIDYTNIRLLHYFIDAAGNMLPRRATSNCAKHQRQLRQSILRARVIGLMSHISDWSYWAHSERKQAIQTFEEEYQDEWDAALEQEDSNTAGGGGAGGAGAGGVAGDQLDLLADVDGGAGDKRGGSSSSNSNNNNNNNKKKSNDKKKKR